MIWSLTRVRNRAIVAPDARKETFEEKVCVKLTSPVRVRFVTRLVFSKQAKNPPRREEIGLSVWS